MIGTLSAVTREPREWTDGDIAFLTTLATHAGIALTNAELFEQTEARAAQLAVLQAASGRLSRAASVEAVGRAIVEETRRIIDYHNARVYLSRRPTRSCRSPSRVGSAPTSRSTSTCSAVGSAKGSRAGSHSTASRCSSTTRTATPRGATITGTDDIDESMLVVPMRYDGVTVGVITLSKLGLDGFDADDLRLLTILADHAATALETARLLTRSQELARELRRLLDMSGELSESLDPRQVANLMAGHLARAMGVDECAISYWDRPVGPARVARATTRRSGSRSLSRTSSSPDTPRRCACSSGDRPSIIDAEDRHADPAEVALLKRDGNRVLVMLPLVAKGQAIGLVEMFSRTEVRWDPQRLEVARTMANEAAMALENARLYEDSRKRADRDPLTGFYNHRYLHERMGEEVVRSQRGKRPLSVIMLDLDDFKLVNDTFGHLFGDRFLAWTAELIRSTLRRPTSPPATAATSSR